MIDKKHCCIESKYWQEMLELFDTIKGPAKCHNQLLLLVTDYCQQFTGYQDGKIFIEEKY